MGERRVRLDAGWVTLIDDTRAAMADSWERGYLAALADVQVSLANEDTVDWARSATGSMVSLPYAIQLIDDMIQERHES